MKLKNALKEFERYLKRTGDGRVPRTPVDGTKRVLSFYKEVQATDAVREADGDMLLFQWGTYDRGDGELFEFDIARQLIGDTGDDGGMWQLHLVYRFAPSEVLRALGRGNPLVFAAGRGRRVRTLCDESSSLHRRRIEG